MSEALTLPKPCVVVSQPMYFPWVGILEQIRICDSFVYYDDVQFARGFFNRVQIKTSAGVRWLTVPLLDWHRGQLINEVKIDNTQNWKGNHRDQLKQAYAAAPFRADMMEIVDEVFSRDYEVIGDLARASTDALVRYFPAIGEDKPFLASSTMGIAGSSSQRLIDICSHLDAKSYLTGHGARNYLDHEGFEAKGIEVAYIDYELDEYRQLHGDFTPYVSSLDLIANCGRDGEKLIRGNPSNWRDFLQAADQTASNK
jgi:hypothetical protein